MAPDNQDRVDAAEAALDAAREQRGNVEDDFQDELTDLLTDLRHFALEHGLSMARAIKNSRMHYLEEKQPVATSRQYVVRFREKGHARGPAIMAILVVAKNADAALREAHKSERYDRSTYTWHSIYRGDRCLVTLVDVRANPQLDLEKIV
jgi:hypothetical protein